MANLPLTLVGAGGGPKRTVETELLLHSLKVAIAQGRVKGHWEGSRVEGRLCLCYSNPVARELQTPGLFVRHFSQMLNSLKC